MPLVEQRTIYRQSGARLLRTSISDGAFEKGWAFGGDTGKGVAIAVHHVTRNSRVSSHALPAVQKDAVAPVLRNDRIWAAQVGNVTSLRGIQAVLFVVFVVQQDIPTAPRSAEELRTGQFDRSASRRAAIAHTSLSTIEILACNDVHNAGHRISAIDYGCAVSQYFDTIDNAKRNLRHVVQPPIQSPSPPPLPFDPCQPGHPPH